MSNYSGINKPAVTSLVTSGYSSRVNRIIPSNPHLVSGQKFITYIMKAKVIADGSYKRWIAYGAPDTTAIYAPVAANLLTDIGVDSIL